MRPARLLGKQMVRGRDEISELVRAVLERNVPWGRHEPLAAQGDNVVVEYRRETPDGEQADSVDVFVVQGGVIKSLRAYLGTRSVATLIVGTYAGSASSAPH